MPFDASECMQNLVVYDNSLSKSYNQWIKHERKTQKERLENKKSFSFWEDTKQTHEDKMDETFLFMVNLAKTHKVDVADIKLKDVDGWRNYIIKYKDKDVVIFTEKIEGEHMVVREVNEEGEEEEEYEENEEYEEYGEYEEEEEYTYNYENNYEGDECDEDEEYEKCEDCEEYNYLYEQPDEQTDECGDTTYNDESPPEENKKPSRGFSISQEQMEKNKRDYEEYLASQI